MKKMAKIKTSSGEMKSRSEHNMKKNINWINRERHSHSAQFSVRGESLRRDFRDTVLLQPSAND